MTLRFVALLYHSRDRLDVQNLPKLTLGACVFWLHEAFPSSFSACGLLLFGRPISWEQGLLVIEFLE